MYHVNHKHQKFKSLCPASATVQTNRH